MVYAALILYYTLESDKVAFKDKAIIIAALGYLISPLDVIPDAIPIAGLGDDLAVLLYVLHKVWGDVSEDAKKKAQESFPDGLMRMKSLPSMSSSRIIQRILRYNRKLLLLNNKSSICNVQMELLS